MSDRRSRDGYRRRDGDRRRGGDSTSNLSGKPIQQTPIILDRRDRAEPSRLTRNESNTPASSMREPHPSMEDLSNENVFADTDKGFTSVPFMRRPNKFNSEAVMKLLLDHPGHFVIGVVGKQGVGKSTILSHFGENPESVFATQQKEQFLYKGHKTDGINIHITSERVILLDTEPIQSWTVLEKALNNGLLGHNNSTASNAWLEMESLYQLIFMMSICDVLLVAMEGPEIDMDILRCVQRAEMLKYHIPDFPLLINQQDLNYYPQVVFVCNNVPADDYTRRMCRHLHTLLRSQFKDTSLNMKGLVKLSNALPFYKMNDDIEEMNLFLLPNDKEEVIETFDFLIGCLRDQVFAAPRRPGKKGQLSERDWYRNALKTYEMILNSEYINEYKILFSKIRDS